MPAGRPTSYKPEYAELACKYCLLGATDKQLAEFFEVAESTIYEWKINYTEFSEAIKRGKEQADAEIASRLYDRARGYTHNEEKIFCVEGQIVRAETIKHYPPDPTSMIFWLKNRNPERWREKQEVKLDLSDVLAQKLAKALERTD